MELCWGPVRQSGRLLRALRRLPGPISKLSLAFLGFRGPSCPSPPRESQGLWRSPEVRGNLQGQEEVLEELTLSACAALQSVRWFCPPGGSRVRHRVNRTSAEVPGGSGCIFHAVGPLLRTAGSDHQPSGRRWSNDVFLSCSGCRPPRGPRGSQYRLKRAHEAPETAPRQPKKAPRRRSQATHPGATEHEEARDWRATPGYNEGRGPLRATHSGPTRR